MSAGYPMDTDRENPFAGVLLAMVFYFVFMFSLCFLKPSHHQFACWLGHFNVAT